MKWKLDQDKKQVFKDAMKKIKSNFNLKDPFADSELKLEKGLLNRKKEIERSMLVFVFKQIFSATNKKLDINTISALIFSHLVENGLMKSSRLITSKNFSEQRLIESRSAKQSVFDFLNGDLGKGQIGNCLIQFAELIALSRIFDFKTPDPIFLEDELYALNLLKAVESALVSGKTDGFLIIPILRDDYILLKDYTEHQLKQKLGIIDSFPEFINTDNIDHLIQILKSKFDYSFSSEKPRLKNAVYLKPGEEIKLEIEEIGYDILIIKEDKQTLLRELISMYNNPHAYSQFSNSERVISLYLPYSLKGKRRYVFKNIGEYLDYVRASFYANFSDYSDALFKKYFEKVLDTDNPGAEILFMSFTLSKILEDDTTFLPEMKKLYYLDLPEIYFLWEQDKNLAISKILNFKIDILEYFLNENSLPDFKTKRILIK